jgi:hypothetical protein
MRDPLPPSPYAAAMPVPALAAPPPDVQALLDAAGLALGGPVYFDAQLAVALQEAQQQWPALWRMAFTDDS